MTTFEIGSIVVSFDLFNPFDEEGLGGLVGIDLFLVETTKRGATMQAFSALAGQLADSEGVAAFGGDSSLHTCYAQAVREGWATQRPTEYLWLWNFFPAGRVDPAAFEGLSVFRVEECRTGTVVQVFEDLTNGYEDVYLEAGRRLGLPAIWSLPVG